METGRRGQRKRRSCPCRASAKQWQARRRRNVGQGRKRRKSRRMAQGRRENKRHNRLRRWQDHIHGRSQGLQERDDDGKRNGLAHRQKLRRFCKVMESGKEWMTISFPVCCAPRKTPP